jgi:four helix bundle protein
MYQKCINEYVSDMNRQSDELLLRFKHFAVAIIKLSQKHKVVLPFSVADQLIRSSTSVGANYAEAQNAISKLDFKNKIYISKKESAETEYWLSIVTELITDTELANLREEAHEITMILQKITTTLRSKSGT